MVIKEKIFVHDLYIFSNYLYTYKAINWKLIFHLNVIKYILHIN